MAGLVAALLSTCLIAVAIFFLEADLRTKIDDQSSANSDTSQWSLAQLEVDLARFQVAVLSALQNEDMGLQDVRRRFDIFFSRVRLNADGQHLRDLRDQGQVASALEELEGFIDRYVALFDGDTEALWAGLPKISADLEELTPHARRFSISGVSDFATSSDNLRTEIRYLLSKVSILTLFMLVSYFIVVLFLLKLIHFSGKSERKAADSRNQLQEVISTAIDGVLTIDGDGRILDYNGAAEKIFGYKREEAVGESMSDLIVPDHLKVAHDKGMARYRKTGENRVTGAGLLRLEAKRKDGEVFPIELSISSAIANDRTIFVSYIRDISDRVRAEKELVEARDKAVAGEKAKANLLAVMSHEIRTPLNGLIGTLELLQSSEMLERQKKYFAAMQTSANLLMHHVDDVLTVSRIDAGKLKANPSEVRVSEFLGGLVESQRQSIEGTGNRISVDLRNAPEFVWADEIKLGQVILNLIGNANKFTTAGDILVECDGVNGGKMVEFRVIDTGFGISAEDLTTVFDDFRTLDPSYGRRSEGTGLGLSISRRLVEAMDGKIGLESEVGVGTMVWFRLPQRSASHASRDESAPGSSAAQGGASRSRDTAPLRILLVEDNEINRLVALDMLEMASHLVDVAQNGANGVEMAEKYRYDLILMDISMPELDGVRATRLIRDGNGPNRATPVLALTAHALPEDFARFRKAGMTDVIVKPLNMKELKRVLSQYAGNVISPAASSAAAMQDAISVLVRHKGPTWAEALLSEFSSEISDLLAKASAWPSDTVSAADLAEIAHKNAGSASVLGLEDVFHLLRGMEDILRSGGCPSEQARAISEAWAPAVLALRDRMDSVARSHQAYGTDQTPASR